MWVDPIFRLVTVSKFTCNNLENYIGMPNYIYNKIVAFGGCRCHCEEACPRFQVAFGFRSEAEATGVRCRKIREEYIYTWRWLDRLLLPQALWTTLLFITRSNASTLLSKSSRISQQFRETSRPKSSLLLNSSRKENTKVVASTAKNQKVEVIRAEARFWSKQYDNDLK